MKLVKRICVLCMPFVLAACGTIPAYDPVYPMVEETGQPASQPAETAKPQVKPQIKPKAKPADVDSAAKAPAAVVALLERAEQQEHLGNELAAVASLERAIRIAPRYPESYYRLGELRYKQGRYAQAGSLGQKALSLGADWWLSRQAQSLVDRAAAH